MSQVSGRSILSISAKLGSLFSIVCLAFVIARGQISASPEQNSHDTYKLNGTVLNAATGEPVAHAMVEIATSIKPAAALTDSNGNFELDGLTQGETTLTVSKPGFFNDEQMSQITYTHQPLVRIGPDMSSITLKLVPEGIIFGQVESSDGRAEGIPVKVFWATVSNGRRVWQRKETRTDDEGNFRLAELLPATYFISAGPSLDLDDMRMRGAGTAEYLPKVFHSGSAEFSGATPIDLTPGQQVQVGFSLKKTPAYTLSGRILGNDFNGGVSLDLWDRSGEPSFLPIRFDPNTKQFSIRASAGSYVLHASALGLDGIMLRGQLALTVSGDRNNFEIALAPSPVIAINVRVEPSAVPQEGNEGGFTVRGTGRIFSRRMTDTFSAAVSTSLQSTGDSLNPRSYWAEQRNGSAQPVFRDVEPGKYTVQIQSNGLWYVQSATCGGVDLLRDDIDVGAHVDPIEIVVRNGGANIQGKLRMAAGRTIHGEVLLVRDAAPREFRTAQIDDNGNFFLSSLAPGGYSLLGFDHLQGVEYRNPEVLNKYLSKAEHVNLDSQQQLETTVELTEIEK